MEGVVNTGMTSIATVVTQLTQFMTQVITTITAEGNEIMLITISIGMFGGAIGLVKRLIG